MARGGRPPFLQQVPVRGFVHYHFAGAVRPHCLAADHFLPAAADNDERAREGNHSFLAVQGRLAGRRRRPRCLIRFLPRTSSAVVGQIGRSVQ